MSAIIAAPHIRLDDRGIAYIDDTETKVISVVRNKAVSGDSPEELREYMPHLSLAQVYAALAYYHDHKPDIDAQIERLDRGAEELIAQAPQGPSRDELTRRLQERAGRQ